MNESDAQNPLLSSCECKGGVQYIHFKCLKDWLNTKKQLKEEENYTTLYYKTFECEICKTPYPYIFKAKVNDREKTYSLVDFKKPQGDYLILESLNFEKNQSRIIHFVHPLNHIQAMNFKIGRGHDSELRINDISVSRCHATVKYKVNPETNEK